MKGTEVSKNVNWKTPISSNNSFSILENKIPKKAKDVIGKLLDSYIIKPPPPPPVNDDKVSWESKNFSIEKAHVCAQFARIAYLYIPDYELNDKKRIKIIPCNEYQKIMQGKAGLDIVEVLREKDYRVFTIENRYFVVIVVKTPYVVFVAIRGTKFLYLPDWLINFNAFRHKVQEEMSGVVHEGFYNRLINSDAFRLSPIQEDMSEFVVHTGFYKVISASFEELSKKLQECGGDKLPIYVTGHSMGGAMAALMHAFWSMTVTNKKGDDEKIDTHSCYTFGMPRYGNSDTVKKCRNLYHIYNKKDIVPTLPLVRMGYADCSPEFMDDGTDIRKNDRRGNVGFRTWMFNLLTGKGINNHYMESYLERIADKCPLHNQGIFIREINLSESDEN